VLVPLQVINCNDFLFPEYVKWTLSAAQFSKYVVTFA